VEAEARGWEQGDAPGGRQVASMRPLQIGVARVTAIDTLAGQDRMLVDPAARDDARWVTIEWLRDDGAPSGRAWLTAGSRASYLHDPEYTQRTFHVRTPVSPLRVGQVRRMILEHVVPLRLVLRLRRLAVAGPELDAGGTP